MSLVHFVQSSSAAGSVKTVLLELERNEAVVYLDDDLSFGRRHLGRARGGASSGLLTGGGRIDRSVGFGTPPFRRRSPLSSG